MFGDMTPEQRAKVDRWARVSQWLSGISLAMLLIPIVLFLLFAVVVLVVLAVVIF